MKRQPFLRRNSMRRSSADDRQGAVLVAVLVCLIVVLGILGNMLKATLLAHRQLHTERDLRQTELLLQAGSDRARFRLANETNYHGETWNLPPGAIVSNAEGRVTIEVSPDDLTTRTVKIAAEYPLGSDASIRRSRTIHFPTQRPREQE